jgi:VIT1/CCC1 family predicted Fe2+/Mn2+ transporter
MPRTTQDGAQAGTRRLYRFAAYNLAAVVMCVALAATKARWLALVALVPAATVAMWIVAARGDEQRGSLQIRT